ncbi:MAG: helix-turn-helix domain-containing protein [Chloroflexota bacterium]|nr:helix-turn-helix domain-containing protein [Chloroflexota bacterium]
MPEDETPSRPAFADKLNYLFATVHPGERGEYTHEEVTEEIRKQGGPAISHTYLWQLRRGVRSNPSLNVLEALAAFFGVPPGYFFDEEITQRVNEQLALATAIRDTNVRNLALRASELSPESVKAILDMVERVRQLEGVRDRLEIEPGGRRRRSRKRSGEGM